MASPTSQYYIELSDEPIRFEPVCKFTSVFFDDANKQVFAVRSGGATGVSVKGPSERSCVNFRMEDKGNVISIKFSPDLKVLAIQRTERSVEFINFLTTGIDTVEYSQSCKGRNTTILGFNWTSSTEIVFITDHGIEYYQVSAERRSLRLLKTYSITINWLVYMPEASILLLSSATLGNVLHPYQFRPGHGTVSKLPKFEVDLPVVPRPPRLSLLERDVTMASIYGQVYIIVLRQQPRLSAAATSAAAPPAGGNHGNNTGCSGAEVVLYQLLKESPARKTDVLKLKMSGRFAINVVDNLIVLHHQPTKTSLLYDIKHRCAYTDGFVNYHRPLLSPLPIKPAQLRLPVVPSQLSGGHPSVVTCDMYSPNWVVFQPNIIIDAKLGCLWYVMLNLAPTINGMFPARLEMVDFLLRRTRAQNVLLQASRDIILPQTRVGATGGGNKTQCGDLAEIADLLDNINAVYHTQMEWEQAALVSGVADMTPPSGTAATSTATSKVVMVEEPSSGRVYQSTLSQSDVYTHLLCPLVEERCEAVSHKFVLAVIVEYLRSLNQRHIPVQHYLYELLINTLVQTRCCYQLHQFIQYHVLSDSKPLACSLLALQTIYPPAHQLALDMLKRLYTANDDMVEVLLSKQQLLSALRFVRSVGIVDNVSSRKFLEAAANASDPMLFYTVFKFFEQRNVKLRGSPAFKEGEQCEEYVQLFSTLFGDDALAATTSTLTNQIS